MGVTAIDLSREPGDQTYCVEMSCMNCSWQGTVRIDKGVPVPRPGHSSSCCPNCGCLKLVKSLDQKPRL